MTEEQWKRAAELFHAALEVPPDQRSAWLAEQCAGDAELQQEVESLLGNDEEVDTGFIESGMAPVVESLLRGPERVGVYRLLREIGRGGMGTVYLAERDDAEYHAQVAVKLVRQGMDTAVVLNRFYRERQTLARLQHPHIARLLDGGTTQSGVPYLVMEYVDGARITDYANQQKLGTRDRLVLFQKVCEAVEYAHRNFVVHRDLKPGNILVDRAGNVKLLDFGICKLLQTGGQIDEETRVTQALLTPEYASPEQVHGQPVTVLSDVYSAGAVLYELLTGAKPHQITEHSLRGLEDAICHRPVPAPSQATANPALARELRGDLDTILMVAMNKDPARRYQSIEGFTEDIRRYLAHEPIRARPDSPGYRVRKFLQRRRSLVSAVAAILLVASIGAFFSWRSARKAESNLRLARQLANTFVVDVYDLVRDLPGATQAKEEIVTTGLRYLDNLHEISGGDSELKTELARAYNRIGDVQGNVMRANLGKTSEALVSYRKALALLDEVQADTGDRPELLIEIIQAHRNIAAIQDYMRDAAAAQSHARARELAETLYARQPEESKVRRALAGAFMTNANAARSQLRIAEARDAYDKARRLLEQEEVNHRDDPYVQGSLAAAFGGLGMCDARDGNLEESLAWYRKSLPRSQNLVRMAPDNVPYRRQLMLTFSHIGDVLGNPNLRNLGDRAGAEEAYRGMLQQADQIFRADPADQRARSDYGIALMRMAVVAATPQDSIRMLKESIAMNREVLRVNPKNASAAADIAVGNLFLGDAHLQANQQTAAVEAYRESLAGSEPILEAANPTLITAALRAQQKLGLLLAQRGEREAARQLAARALKIGEPDGKVLKARPENVRHTLIPRAQIAAGLIHAAVGDVPQARNHLTRAFALYSEIETTPLYTKSLAAEVDAARKTLEKLP